MEGILGEKGNNVWDNFERPNEFKFRAIEGIDSEVNKGVISISIYFVQKYNNIGNSNDTWTGQLGIYHALTAAHSKRTVIKITYTLHIL